MISVENAQNVPEVTDLANTFVHVVFLFKFACCICNNLPKNTRYFGVALLMIFYVWI